VWLRRRGRHGIDPGTDIEVKQMPKGMTEPSIVHLAVAGVGGWGRNLARNYAQIPGCDLRYICDTSAASLTRMLSMTPRTIATTSFDQLLKDPVVQAVVIATPAATHYQLCRAALLAGKDVYVEKPFVLEVAQAEELVTIAEQEDRILMVGHLLEYHPIVNRLKDMIETRQLGDIYYLYNQRVNLGTIRNDENALWNFAPHDVSSILYLLQNMPTDVSARGQSYLKSGVEDTVFITLNFNDRAMAHIHVSWLDPHKIRKMTIVGSQKMAVFDDNDSNEKLRIYDKGAAYASDDYKTYAEYVTMRFGDITIPYLKTGEPLELECLHFLDCVREHKRPRSDGYDGLKVVKVLDAAQRSLRSNGAPVAIEPLSMRVPGVAA
jgi:predicted dehydrogenase